MFKTLKLTKRSNLGIKYQWSGGWGILSPITTSSIRIPIGQLAELGFDPKGMEWISPQRAQCFRGQEP